MRHPVFHARKYMPYFYMLKFRWFQNSDNVICTKFHKRITEVPYFMWENLHPVHYGWIRSDFILYVIKSGLRVRSWKHREYHIESRKKDTLIFYRISKLHVAICRHNKSWMDKEDVIYILSPSISLSYNSECIWLASNKMGEYGASFTE